MRKLLSVTGFTAMLTALRMCMGLVVAKVVAIHTGPSGMAMLGQVQSLMMSLTGIAASPVGTCVVKYTAKHNEESLEACSFWWKASLQWLLILLSVMVPVIVIFSDNISIWLFESQKMTWLIYVIAFTLPLSAINILVSSVINGLQQFKKLVYLGMVATVVSTITMLIFIYQFNLKGALFSAAINTSISGLVLIVSSFREPWFKAKLWWGSVEKEHRKAVSSYILMAITSAVMAPMTVLIIRKLIIADLGWESAGIWQAVWKISEIYLSVITISLGTYFLPRLSKLSRLNEIKEEIWSTVIVIMPIVILLSTLIFLTRDISISILFTDEFNEARDLYYAQLIGDSIKIMAWLYAYPMLANKATYWYISSEVFFSLFFILLTKTLLLYFGLVGVQFAYILTYSLYFIFSYLIMGIYIKK